MSTVPFHKPGTCSTCLARVDVTWHQSTRRFYCASCVPRAGQAGGLGDLGRPVPAPAAVLGSRMVVYGHHVADGAEAATFAVVCPKLGVVADRLPIHEARSTLAAHEAICSPRAAPVRVPSVASDDVPW